MRTRRGLGKRFNIIHTIILIVLIIVLFVAFAEGGQDQTNQGTTTEWTLLGKIDENEDDLKAIKLKIGKKKYTHNEERIVYNSEGRITSVTRIKITDFDRQIALKLLNLDTGETKIIVVQKRGLLLNSPVGYEVQVVKRRNGIEWNGRNTHLKVVNPKSNIVIKIALPDEKTKKNLIYSPYSTDDPNTPDEIESGIHTLEVVASGTDYLSGIFNMACQILRERGVRSRAFPQHNVCYLPFLPIQAYRRLLLIEQMDESEFNIDSRKTAERVLVILRANPDRAFTTCNSSKASRACGAMQFTDRWRGKKRPGTYSTIVMSYPEAKLIKSFPAGAFDHVNAAMATVLLHDDNLRVIVDKFGQRIIEKIYQDPMFTEMILNAAYNGSPNWVHLSLRATASKNFEGWSEAGYLRKETGGYLLKHGYLIKNNLP